MSRTYTDEEKAAWAEKMRAAKEAKAALTNPVELDVTKDNLVSEADLIERIRRMFDTAEIPEVIKVNSKQLLEILDVSNRFIDFDTYQSPFADHQIVVIPAKEIL